MSRWVGGGVSIGIDENKQKLLFAAALPLFLFFFSSVCAAGSSLLDSSFFSREALQS